MTDFVQQRRNMIESQVRPVDITDRRIIRAMGDIPRERFVPEALRPLAYMDGDLELGTSKSVSNEPSIRRALLAPRTLAKLIQLADIGVEDTVLHVGCATGYGTAVLARLAKTVVAVEPEVTYVALARAALAELALNNTEILMMDGLAGDLEGARYDAILVEGRISDVPHTLLGQLRDGGRLVAIMGGPTLAQARRWRRHGTAFGMETAFEATAHPLPGFTPAPAFVF